MPLKHGCNADLNMVWDTHVAFSSFQQVSWANNQKPYDIIQAIPGFWILSQI